MLKRLDLAFQAFFRRVRAGQAPGFPRFRSISRCRTIDVADPHNGMVSRHHGDYLIRLKGFPRLRVRSAQALAAGRAAEVCPPDAARPPLGSVAGVCSRAAAVGTVRGGGGYRHGRPQAHDLFRWHVMARAQRDWKRKRRLQRSVSRSRKGSATRRKRVAALPHGSLASSTSASRNACHRATTGIIRQHGLIAVEALKVTNMTRSAKGTADRPGSNVKAKAGLNRSVRHKTGRFYDHSSSLPDSAPSR